MRNSQIIVVLLLLLSLVLSCNKYSKNKIGIVIHIKDVECPNIPTYVRQIKSHLITIQAFSCLSYYNSNNNTMGVCLVEKGQNKNIPGPFQRLVTKGRHESALFVHSMDSIYYFDRDIMEVFLFDTSGQIIDKFSINSKNHPNSMISSFFFVCSESLFYSWVPETDFSNRISRERAFKTNSPICEVRLDSTISHNNPVTFGIFPDDYKEGKNYYDFSPNIFKGLKNEIIVSYEADHYLYVYRDSTLIEKVKCKSNFIDDFEDISDENFSNLSYCQTYQGQEPRYTNLIIDPFMRRYYRIVKLRMEIGKIDKENTKWTMIVLTDTFDVIGEVSFSYFDYMPDIIIPTMEGLYVKKSPKNETEYKGNLTLSLLNFSL